MNRRQFVLGLGGTVAVGVTGLNALSTNMTMEVKAEESTELDDSFVFTGTSASDFDDLEITFTDFTINLENELDTDLNVTVNAELNDDKKEIHESEHELNNEDEIELKEGIELINTEDNVFSNEDIDKPSQEEGELIVSDEERMEFTLTFNLEEVDDEDNNDEFEEIFELRLTISSIEDEIIADDDNSPVLKIIDNGETEVDLIGFYDEDEIEDELVTILEEKPAVL